MLKYFSFYVYVVQASTGGQQSSVTSSEEMTSDLFQFYAILCALLLYWLILKCTKGFFQLTKDTFHLSLIYILCTICQYEQMHVLKIFDIALKDSKHSVDKYLVPTSLYLSDNKSRFPGETQSDMLLCESTQP